ncbi:hypothetical protein ACFLTS_04125, partial [Chloroflexota bacterium]
DKLGTNHIIFHGYAVLYLDGRWLKATPAFDIMMCRDFNLPPVDFDGKSDAMFSDRGMDGKPFIEYVRDRGFFDDVPLDDMLPELREFYGTERMKFWEKAPD